MAKAKVLVLDDEAHILKWVKSFLEDDFEIFGASDSDNALLKLKTTKIDVAIIDVKLNKNDTRDGWDVLKFVKDNYPEVGTIMLTSYDSMDYDRRAMGLGADDFMSKVVDRNKLLERVVKTMEKVRIRKERSKAVSLALAKNHRLGKIIGRGVAMRDIFRLIGKVAKSDSTVLILGKSGTGKELVAETIYKLSHRSKGPYVVVNCAAIPKNLIESELFGHKKGAFTDAIVDKPGKFQVAQGGTIFLDEIGDMSTNTQTKILRVLESNEIVKIGDTTPINVDVRIIAATNKNLKKSVKNLTFREDLYYRLNVFEIHLPLLQERKEDIPLLIQNFIERFSNKYQKNIIGISQQALQILSGYDWPGNVRELRNMIERAVVLSEQSVISESDLPLLEGINEGENNIDSLDALASLPYKEFMDVCEKRYLTSHLRHSQNNISQAATKAKIDRSNFRKKMEKHGLTK